MDWTALIIAIPVLLVSLSFHEAAHAAVAHLLGDDTAKAHGRLTLNPVKHFDPVGSTLLVVLLIASQGSWGFGWARPVPVDPRAFRSPRHGMMWTSLAGPAANLAMALVGAGLLWVVRPFSLDAALGCYFVFVINVILAAFNMLPIPPLDGSKVLGGLLPEDLSRMWTAFGERSSLMLVFVVVAVAGGALRTYLSWPLHALGHLVLPAAWQLP